VLNNEQLVDFAAGIPGAPSDEMTPAMVEFPNFPVVSPVAQVRGSVSDRELGAEFRAAGVRKGDELAACPGRVREYWNDHRAGMWNALTRVMYRRLSSMNGSHKCERFFRCEIVGWRLAYEPQR
jgi:hypothetical protein